MLCPECYTDNPDDSSLCESCGCPLVSIQENKKRLLRDRYQIISALSAGGMGEIHLGYDVRLKKPCVLKGLIKKGLKDIPYQERALMIKPFEIESEILSTLRHPNLPCVTDYFIENDSCYIIMDYIEGKDLEVMLEEEGGGLPEKDVLEWAIQVCRVLEYLHSQDPPIIHGDLKPANLIIREADGMIMLVDFGSASFKTLKPDKSQPYGTDGYAPPEQYMGIQEIRSDIYSLGCTMYELLTGNLPEEPFNFPPPQKVIPEITSDMDRIVMNCLEFKLENRIRNATSLKQRLLASYKKNFRKSKGKFKTSTLSSVAGKMMAREALGKSQASIKVLIVDDEINMCNTYMDILKFFKNIIPSGIAYNGDEAIKTVIEMEEKPDVIIMDCNMPVMNGIEATKRILNILPSVKIIIVSAYLDEEMVIASFNNGASGYILKNEISWEELDNAIKKAYDGGMPISPEVSPLLVKELISLKSSPDPLKQVKKCPSCKRLNRAEARFCSECGMEVSKAIIPGVKIKDSEEEIIEEIVYFEDSETGEEEEEIIEEIIVYEDEEDGNDYYEEEETPSLESFTDQRKYRPHSERPQIKKKDVSPVKPEERRFTLKGKSSSPDKKFGSRMPKRRIKRFE